MQGISISQRNLLAVHAKVPPGRTSGFLCWLIDCVFIQRSSPMGRAERYWKLATEVRIHASKEANPILKAEWENLAGTYVRLAGQTEGARGAVPTYDPIWDILDRSAR